MARVLDRRQRRHRRLQGRADRAAADRGRPRGARDPDAEQPAVRRARRRSPGSPARRCCAASSTRTRCAAPIRASPASARGARPDPASGARAACRAVPDRTGQRQHDRQARARTGRQPGHDRGARGRLSGDRRARDERPDVRAPGDPGQPRAAARARGPDRRTRTPASWPRTASTGPAGCPSPRSWPPRASGCSAPAASRGWAGVRVLVTAGGTREPIDPVRYIGNRSSGRMGLSLAAAAARRGADVTVVAANVSLPAPAGVRVVAVQTAAELLDACEARFDAADVLLMAAAVADFRPRAAAAAKIKKRRRTAPRWSSSRRPTCSARCRPGGAPARCSSGSPPRRARARSPTGARSSTRKRLDAIVVNDVARRRHRLRHAPTTR